MTSQRTEKRPFESAYGGGFIRADQWITEKLCTHIAVRQEKELPDRFWQQPEWAAIFRRQVQQAASLLLLFDPAVVARTLKDKRIKNIRSFKAFDMIPAWYEILQKKQFEFDAQMVAYREYLDGEKAKEGSGEESC